MRSGEISIPAVTANILGLSHGDHIEVREEGSEFYLLKSEEKACRVWSTKNGSKNLRAHYKKLTDEITDMHGGDDCYFRVGEPVRRDNGVWLPIITRKNYNHGT